MPFFRIRRARNRDFIRGDRARDARRWHLAAAHYRRALAAEPANAALWVQYGHAVKEAGDAAAGEAAYRKAIELMPDVADTHLQLGHVLKQQGRTEEAVAAYLAALTIDPGFYFASSELLRLGWGGADLDGAAVAALKQQLRQKYPNPPRPAGSAAPSIIFDVSDLILYFMTARVPTGIQRVQINVIAGLLRERRSGADVGLACFSAGADHWTAVPERLFLDLTDLAVAGGSCDDPAWRGALSEANCVLLVGERVEFRPGAVVVNLGASWCLQNYFLMIRSMKARYGVRYVPFIHDCIPVLEPHHFTRELAQDFLGWIIGVFHYADGILVNSQATAADLAEVARRLGHPAPQPSIIRLDACSSGAPPAGPGANRISKIAVRRRALDRAGFVLFVSTIESRKNHLLAFEAWLSLIERRGLRNTPMLVCVGHVGWLVDAAMQRLDSSRLLRRKVVIRSNVSDAALASLYRDCLFTLYPSSHEGWGLPITESLCHGKVPLISTVSSMPEAGGEFAEYFDLQSQSDLVDKLARLIGDGEYRAAQEAKIRSDFRPRSWTGIADEIVARAGTLGPATAAAEIRPLPVEIGRYYGLSRNRETTALPGMIPGEMYRIGHGWRPPADWGSWLRGEVADIGFRLPSTASGHCALHLGLRAGAGHPVGYAISVGDNNVDAGMLAAGEDRWVMLGFESEAQRKGEVDIRLTATDAGEADRDAADRQAPRLGVIGFFLRRWSDLAARDRFLEALAQKPPRLAVWTTGGTGRAAPEGGIAMPPPQQQGSYLDSSGGAPVEEAPR